MKSHLLLIGWIRGRFVAISDRLAELWKSNFYLYLAALFTLFAILDTTTLHLTANMRQGTFDLMVRYRLMVPKPDPKIVIVDIDERSLAAMAPEFGRWPWPRQVLGEFVEKIEAQKPKAVVFDILFSDADIYNPDSDAYFDSVIAATANTFFPMLRLDTASDRYSEIMPGMIPGVTPVAGESDPYAHVALILPHFNAAIEGGRLGLHNIEPDPDGVARNYPLWRNDYGWKIPSLPARIGRELTWQEPEQQKVLLNWRGKPFTYPYVSFSDLFADMGKQQPQRAQDEFTDKIVIIGSTAPSLFDIKATPMDRMHPGVEILATAIDDLKHGDYLRYPEARTPYLLLTLAIVWLTAYGFWRNVGRNKIDRLFGASQFILIAISYASINFSHTYINLTGPVTVAIAYFTLARLYSSATFRALEQSMVRTASRKEGELTATLLLIRLEDRHNLLTDPVLEAIRYGLERSGSEAKSVEVLRGNQKGLWGLFEDTLALSWVAAREDGEAASRIDADVEQAKLLLPKLLKTYAADSDSVASLHLQRGFVHGGEQAAASWRHLFAEALLAWNEENRNG